MKPLQTNYIQDEETNEKKVHKSAILSSLLFNSRLDSVFNSTKKPVLLREKRASYIYYEILSIAQLCSIWH